MNTIKGAVPLETADGGVMLCIYLVVCSMYAYFVVAVETDSSYKPSFKKKDRPGTEKQRYKP